MQIANQIAQFGLQACTIPWNGILRPATRAEQSMIDELRSKFSSMPQVSNDGSSDAAVLWAQFQNSLTRSVMTKDPRAFLSWDVILKTMFLSFSSYTLTELFQLRRRRDWHSRWKGLLRESAVGRPARFPFYPRTSANLIHDAYTICAFEDATGNSTNDYQNILEFGGGYGSMCRFVFNQGFRGTYAIYDLPPFSHLQSYYLRSLRIPLLSLASLGRGERGVVLLSDEMNSLFTPEPFRNSKSLFIATWSLSEAPLAIRQQFLTHVAGFDAFLIAYQERFAEINNRDFFERWQDETSESIDWRHVPIPHIRGGQRYLFGTRRSVERRVAVETGFWRDAV